MKKFRPRYHGPFARHVYPNNSVLARLRLRGRKHYDWRVRAVAELLARIDPGRPSDSYDSIAVAVIAIGDQSYEVLAGRFKK